MTQSTKSIPISFIIFGEISSVKASNSSQFIFCALILILVDLTSSLIGDNKDLNGAMNSTILDYHIF
jgi:hypothetical protein